MRNLVHVTVACEQTDHPKDQKPDHFPGIPEESRSVLMRDDTFRLVHACRKDILRMKQALQFDYTLLDDSVNAIEECRQLLARVKEQGF
jgi:hypothetical protein